MHSIEKSQGQGRAIFMA